MANVAGGVRAYVAFQVQMCPELKEKLARRSYETGKSQREIVAVALDNFLKSRDSKGNAPRKSLK